MSNERNSKRSDFVLWQKPHIHRKIQNATCQHKKPQKTHPSGLVKQGLKGTNLPPRRNSSEIKRTRHGRNIFLKYKIYFCQDGYI